MVRKLTPTRIVQKVSVEEVLRARNQVAHGCETGSRVWEIHQLWTNAVSIDFSATSYWAEEQTSDQRPTSAIR